MELKVSAMSRILDETKAEIEQLYCLGVVSEDDFKNVVKLTARDMNISVPIANEEQQIVVITKN
jgi:hypothetical protein